VPAQHPTEALAVRLGVADTEPNESPAAAAAGTAERTRQQGPKGTATAAVVYNPIKVNLEALKAAVKAAEETAGWNETRWYETSEEDPGQGPTRQAVEDGAAVVMAAGGDGTVRAVAEALQGTGVALALLPSGTGNLLARNLDLTLDNVEESVSTAFAGDDRAIDLGLVDIERAGGERERHAFVVMAGAGLDAKMIANTDPELKKKAGWLAYVDAIRKSLADKNRITMRWSLDGSPVRTTRVHTILVGNCGSLPANILLLPDAAVDDGIFDIVALRPEGFVGWVQIWVKVVWENGVLRRSTVGRKLMGLTKEVRTLRYLKGKNLTMRFDRPEDFELDGDAFGEVVAVKTSIDAGGITVKVPSAA
jgi:diacylglycerol kinase (ATP)